jgi:hypothetical protein
MVIIYMEHVLKMVDVSLSLTAVCAVDVHPRVVISIHLRMILMPFFLLLFPVVTLVVV